jgi:predicted dehydrogenase
VGMDIPRAPFYAKELELRLSRSYGPGRYDREYEERGLDYPVGYVRWTERRNIAAFLDLIAAGTVSVEPLITQRVPVEEAPEAYERLMDADSSPLGIVLEYRESTLPKARGPRPAPGRSAVAVSAGAQMNVGVIGAGSFAQRLLMPGLKRAKFTLTAVASGSGLSARAAADRFGFANAVAVDDLIHDPSVGVLAIATRHGSHARLSVEGLMAGKLVFVEKPPCLNVEELSELRAAVVAAPQPLIVGFNRRHAPAAQVLRDHAARRHGPLELLYRVNAGTLDPDHWLNDPEDGGGRLIGEGCHFVDFASWAVGAVPTRVMCMVRGGQGFTITMEFLDGSLATVFYETGGATALPKERIEAHADGGTVVVDDFQRVEVHHGRKVQHPHVRAGKGHAEQFLHLATVARHEKTPLPPNPLDTMAATLAAVESAATGRTVSPDEILAPGPSTVLAETSSHTEVN